MPASRPFSRTAAFALPAAGPLRVWRRSIALVAGAFVAVLPAVSPAQVGLAPGSRVAIIGDSITEQKLYIKYMECYLLACAGVPDLHVMQFGWSGETAGGFAHRAENDLAVFQPTVATLCYGMNDGGYQPWRDEIGASYEKNMRAVLDRLEAAGVKTVVVGSPGAVDTDFFRPGQTMGDAPAHAAYNDTLAHLRDVDRRLASEKGQRFADVHAAMADAMQRAKQTLGAQYDVCGRDGFHPGPNGQLLMAYAFLKALGLDGGIGAIVVDMKAGARQPGPGHRIVRESHGEGGASVDLESTRWPFCFNGDAQGSGGTRSIVPFVDFNQDLNRLVLTVTGLDAARAKVTWGEESREFPRDRLAAGVNLAAEFPRTPFDAPFAALDTAVAQKQGFETVMVKQFITNFRLFPDAAGDAEVRQAAATLTRKLAERRATLDAGVRQRLVPVAHTLRVEPLP
jgi:lysophospholipase L1-like esterase